MKYISLFSGIEAASVAWKDLGWECVGVCEIEKFPSAILQRHYPNVPNFGDITTLTEEKLNDIKKIHGAIDIVVGGSPCQSFSNAGKRRGLKDKNGQLMLEYIRVIETLRPKYFIWENVPGVLSNDEGRAFGTLLKEMAECGYSLGWRVLDAKYFGVPQRRRRIFLIGCIGNNTSPFEILFESESSERDIDTSRTEREENTSKVERSSSEHAQSQIFLTNSRSEVRFSGGNGLEVGCLSANSGMNQTNYVLEPKIFMLKNNRSDLQHTTNSTESYCLTAAMGDGGGNVPMIVSSIPLLGSSQPNAMITDHAEYSPCLTSAMGSGGGHIPMVACIPTSEYYYYNQTNGNCTGPDDVAGTVIARYGTGGGNVPFVKENPNLDREYVGALCARDYKGPSSDDVGSQKLIRHSQNRVRKLTCLECERLQGFPDNYTRIKWRGKEEKDCPLGPRYKALGNSMAVPVMRWLGERINMFEKLGHCNGYKFSITEPKKKMMLPIASKEIRHLVGNPTAMV